MTKADKYLTPEAHEDLQQKILEGEATLVIPPGVARHFFARVSNSSVEGTTGFKVTAEKVLIWSGLIVAPTLLLTCFAYVAQEFGWFAALAIPLIGVFWTIFAGYTNEHGKWQPMSVLFVLSVLNLWIMEQAYAVPLVLFTVSLWVHRLTYIFSQAFLIGIVIESFAAYDMLAEHVEITEV